MVKLMEMGGRPVTLLDGDVVRKHLSSELGFSKEHRDINIRRIGYVASEITKNGGIAICAPIAPYARPAAVREMVEAYGAFVEVHVATPSRNASGATARASTSWRARARSRSSPASPTPTRRPRSPSCGSTPRTSTSTTAPSRCS
jgi:sulfate adenylyltransferase